MCVRLSLSLCDARNVISLVSRSAGMANEAYGCGRNRTRAGVFGTLYTCMGSHKE